MKKMLWSVLGIVGMLVVAYGESFELPNYQGDQSIDKVDGWAVKGESFVTRSQAADGDQAVQLNGGAKISRQVIRSDVRFIDFAVLPVYGKEGLPALLVNAAGTDLSFLRRGTVGKFTVIPREEEKQIELEGSYPINAEGNLGRDWIVVTIRQDLKAGTWDLYLNAKLALIDQVLGKELGLFLMDNASEEAVFLDFYSESSTNPLFADVDGDGMPDAFEVANGLNAYWNDRDADFDGDGVSNIEEFLGQSSPRTPAGMQIPGSILYVDNGLGDDGNSGSASYVMGGDGPKASIKAAMASASSGDTIVVLPGKGIYDEGSRGEPGKRLTIKAMKNVIIK